MKDAIKYFMKLADMQEDNYVPYVYISHANEYLYNKTGKKKFLNFAKKSITKAAELNPSNEQVIMQIKNLGITKKNDENQKI